MKIVESYLSVAFTNLSSLSFKKKITNDQFMTLSIFLICIMIWLYVTYDCLWRKWLPFILDNRKNVRRYKESPQYLYYITAYYPNNIPIDVWFFNQIFFVKIYRIGIDWNHNYNMHIKLIVLNIKACNSYSKMIA